MRLTSTSILPCCLAAALAPFGLLAKTDYATLLPSSSDLYVEVGSISKLESLDTLPIFKVFNSEELKKFFTPLIKKIEEESDDAAQKILADETGLSEKELDAKFPRGFAFSIYDYKIKPKEDIAWSLEGAILTEFTGDDALAAKIVSAIGKTAQHNRAEAEAKAKKDKAAGQEPEESEDEGSAKFPEDYVETKADYKGVNLHLWKLKPEAHDVLDQFAWAVHDGVLIFSTAETEIKTIIDRAKSGSAKETLAGSPSHRDVLNRAGSNDILVSVDLSGIIAQGVKSLADSGAEKRNPGQFNPSKLVDALGASDFRNLFLSLSFAPEQADLNYGVTYAKKPGLFSLFTLGPGTGAAPGFLPTDAPAASYGRFDMLGFVNNLEKLVVDVYPPAGIILAGQLAQLKAATGVDLKADLLGNIDRELFSVAEPSAAKAAGAGADEDSDNPLAALGQQNQVVGFKLKDRSAFELAIKSLINGLAPDKAIFEPRDYLGFKIQVVKGSEDTPMPFAYVLTDDHLLLSIGQPALLEKILGRISKKATDGVFTNPVIAAALENLPDGANSVAYQDVDSLAQIALQAMAKVAEQAAEESGFEIVDPKQLPKNLKFPHFMVSKSYMDENAVVGRARLLLRPEGR